MMLLAYMAALPWQQPTWRLVLACLDGMGQQEAGGKLG